MATLTIRGIDPALMERLQERAEANGRTVEEEALRALEELCPSAERTEPTPEKNIAQIFTELFGPENGVELELPERSSWNWTPHKFNDL